MAGRQCRPFTRANGLIGVSGGRFSSHRPWHVCVKLIVARCPPHVLDDYTVGRLVEVYTAQRDDLWLWDEQLRRWASESLGRIHRREVERLQGQIAALHKVVDDILALADELAAGTIEKMMAKSDVEVGLDMLTRLARKQGQ